MSLEARTSTGLNKPLARVSNSCLIILLIAIGLLNPTKTNAQIASNPVQVTSNLIPPYSLYLSDYSDASQNKWNIQLLLKDFTQTDYQAKLRITIEGAGIRLRTRRGFSPGPIRLEPGMPYKIDATDLTQYLNIQNMEVSGINRNKLASTQKLPEGFYHFKIEVLDYNRNNRVSNIGNSIAWLVLNDPPLLNLPFEEKLRLQDPQQVQFQWTPRHTSSPNSAFETEYIFKLWEIWPEDRDPNEVARTTRPLFETTIMTTSYFYGLNDAMLIPGRSYAWQVQAINLSGRDLFKNQGKSEVKSFQYGDACQPITNLGAEAMGTDRIRITWKGEWNHNRFVAQIREKGNEQWFNYGTNLETQVVYDLKANTEYEIRVIPSCGAIDGDTKNILTLRTLKQEIQDFDCGAEPNRPEITNQEPIDQLQIGDRITAAGFTVILTELNQMGNTYSGLGLIEVPLFNGARVEAKLNSIIVNTDKQLISGNIESIYNPNGPFIIGLDQDEPGLSEEGSGNQEEGEEDSFDQLPEPDINIEGEIEDVIIDEDTGTITVIDADGNETEIDRETADENGDGNIAIEDDKGNVWVVDEGGNMSGPHQPSPENPNTVRSDEPIDFIVHFAANEKQHYGFDIKQHESLASEYEQTEINGEVYSIPWKSVKIGSTDPITAEIIGKDEFPESIGFKNLSSNLSIAPSESETAKTVTVQTTTEKEEITAYVLQETTNEEGETEEVSVPVGKLNVKQYELIRKNIVLVPVNDASIPSASTLQRELNKIYGQAVAEWEVSTEKPYEVSSEVLEELNDGESGMFASFPQNMRQFNRQFKRSVDFDKDAYYLFIIEGNAHDKAGFMPFKRQYGYIYKDKTENLTKTIAHELGHGAFRLRHTFSDEAFIANQKSTDNLMDYKPNGTELYKHQWDLVHDPESMIGWLEDDGEGEMGSAGAIDFLSLDSDSKLSLKPEPIKLKYSINNWEDEIKELVEKVDGLSLDLSDYHLMIFVTQKEIEEEEGISYREVVYTDKLQDISESDGEIEWNGQISINDEILNSSNEANYVLNLGVLHNSQLDKNFNNGKFIIDERDENGLYRIIENGSNQPKAFIDLIPDIEFEVNKAGENWEEVEEEVKSIVDNFEAYESFESIIRDQSHGIGESFENVENPLQYIFNQTEEVEFLKTKIRVHSAFKEKLEAIEEELGNSLIDVYSSETTTHPPNYKDNIGGINLRKIQESTKISNHSYGLCVDIYPKGNIYLINSNYKGYQGDMEVIAFINHVTDLNIMNMNDARLIVEKNQMFVDLLKDYDLNDFQTATEIFMDYENDNPFSSFDEFIISLETRNSSAAQTYYDRVNKLNDLLNSSNPVLEFLTFSELGRSQLNQMKKLIQQLYSDISPLENDFSNENMSNLLDWVEDNNYAMGEIGEIINDLNSFKSAINDLGYTNFKDYSEVLVIWNSNRFNNNLFQDGFSDVPITLINAFLNQQDISWGGTWKSGRVDYMHFEIPEDLVSDYLTE
jgi:hypothetical protein